MKRLIALLCVASFLTTQMPMEGAALYSQLAPASPLTAKAAPKGLSASGARQNNFFRAFALAAFLGWASLGFWPQAANQVLAQENQENEEEDERPVEHLLANMMRAISSLDYEGGESGVREREWEAITSIKQLEERQSLEDLHYIMMELNSSNLDYNVHPAVYDALLRCLITIIGSHQNEILNNFTINHATGRPIYTHPEPVPVSRVAEVVMIEMDRRVQLAMDLEQQNSRAAEREVRRQRGEEVNDREDDVESRMAAQFFRLYTQEVRAGIVPLNRALMDQVIGNVVRWVQTRQTGAGGRRLLYGLIQAVGDLPVNSGDLKWALGWLGVLEETARANGYWSEQSNREFLAVLYAQEARSKLTARATEEGIPLPAEPNVSRQEEPPADRVEQEEGASTATASSSADEINWGSLIVNFLIILAPLAAIMAAVFAIWRTLKLNKLIALSSAEPKTDIRRKSDITAWVPPREKRPETKRLVELNVPSLPLGEFIIIIATKPTLDMNQNNIFQAVHRPTGQKCQFLETGEAGRFLINLAPAGEAKGGFQPHWAWDKETRAAVTVWHFQGFWVTQMLGQGGMGAVYRAWDPAKKESVAIKRIKTEAAANEQFEEFKKRFIREMTVMAMINHPNVVRIHGGSAEPFPYFVMDDIDGVPLDGILKGKTVLPISDAIEIAIQTAEGLKALKDDKGNDIIHRDLKPANLFVTRAGKVQVADFGLIKLKDAKTQLTQSGSIVGTPKYMSPEQTELAQFGLKDIDRRADIYALGVLIYRMLAGQTPFEDVEVYGLIRRKSDAGAHEKHKKLREVRPDLPAGMDDIVRNAMAFNPNDRYQTLDQLIGALKALKEDETKRFQVRIRSSVRKKIKIGALLAVPFILLSSFLLSLWISPRNRDADSSTTNSGRRRGTPDKEFVSWEELEALLRNGSFSDALVLLEIEISRYAEEAEVGRSFYYRARIKIEQARQANEAELKRELYTQAMQDLDQAIQRMPALDQNPLFYYFRALGKAGLGDRTGALDDLRLFRERAAAADPEGLRQELEQAREMEERLRLLGQIRESPPDPRFHSAQPFELAL